MDRIKRIYQMRG